MPATLPAYRRPPATAERLSADRRGFTLLELIISVALVLVLMLAITKIFSITSTTIGASQGISAAVRDARAAQAVFARDIGAMAPDSPFVWIRCDAPLAGFRSRSDQDSDLDGNKLTIDLDGTDADGVNGVEGDTTVRGEIITPYAVNNRNHRLDRLSFCARDRFARQTGNGTNTTPTPSNVLVSGLTSPEAWIYYGPLCLPRNDGSFFLAGSATAKCEPGSGDATTNPNNYFANQWVLGRFAPLMVEPGVNGRINDTEGPQEYFPIAAGTLQPFDSATPARPASGTGTMASTLLRSARYDLIGVDIATAKAVINNFAISNNWVTTFAKDSFEVNPYVIKPIDAKTSAGQVPIFVGSVSQFIVEFAGDFFQQDAAGNIVDTDIPANGTACEPDGQIDYYVDPVTNVRQIRWYGFPRDSNNNGILSVVDGDVMPVSDVASTANPTPVPPGTPYTSPNNPFARFEHFAAAQPLAPTYAFPATFVSRNSYTTSPPAAQMYGSYYAAFGPDSINNPQNPRPRMYRITMTIDRPEMAGRTADGQTFEYVFNAP